MLYDLYVVITISFVNVIVHISSVDCFKKW